MVQVGEKRSLGEDMELRILKCLHQPWGAHLHTALAGRSSL
jgi:hypothetical protein